MEPAGPCRYMAWLWKSSTVPLGSSKHKEVVPSTPTAQTLSVGDGNLRHGQKSRLRPAVSTPRFNAQKYRQVDTGQQFAGALLGSGKIQPRNLMRGRVCLKYYAISTLSTTVHISSCAHRAAPTSPNLSSWDTEAERCNVYT